MSQYDSTCIHKSDECKAMTTFYMNLLMSTHCSIIRSLISIASVESALSICASPPDLPAVFIAVSVGLIAIKLL